MWMVEPFGLVAMVSNFRSKGSEKSGRIRRLTDGSRLKTIRYDTNEKNNNNRKSDRCRRSRQRLVTRAQSLELNSL
jgi:hypothetical protein